MQRWVRSPEKGTARDERRLTAAFVRRKAQSEEGAPREGRAKGESPGHTETAERRKQRRRELEFPEKTDKGTRDAARIRRRREEGHGNLLSRRGCAPDSSEGQEKHAGSGCCGTIS